MSEGLTENEIYASQRIRTHKSRILMPSEQAEKALPIENSTRVANAANRASSGWKTAPLFLGFLVASTASLVFLFSPYTRSESAFILIIFNFFFVSLTFPLEGALALKLLLLSAGNAVGFVWNSLLSMLFDALSQYFGGSSSTSLTVIGPVLNLIWIVSFWSVSLTTLSWFKNRRTGA